MARRKVFLTLDNALTTCTGNAAKLGVVLTSALKKVSSDIEEKYRSLPGTKSQYFRR